MAPSDHHQDGQIGKDELRQIQDDTAATTRPRWQTGPPAKFGTPAAGKPKADQWRSAIEFDIPVSLMKLWSAAPVNDDTDLRRRLLDSTMYLATAIRWATVEPPRAIPRTGSASEPSQRFVHWGDALAIWSRARMVDVSI